MITEVGPFVAAIDRTLEFVDWLGAAGMPIRHIDVGGGLGIRHGDERPPSIENYLGALFDRLAARKLRVLLEPGRALVGNAGLLLTRVEYLKHGTAKNFAVVDAAMNDFLRPALYDAWHEILPVVSSDRPQTLYDVVGPICESADFLAKSRPLAISQGDLLAVTSTGAYGMSMSSNYNSRPRPAEVMVDADAMHLIRDRESAAGLFASERLLP